MTQNIQTVGLLSPGDMGHSVGQTLVENGRVFDAVLLLEVVEHVPDVPAFLKRIAPLVAPGAALAEARHDAPAERIAGVTSSPGRSSSTSGTRRATWSTSPRHWPVMSRHSRTS